MWKILFLPFTFRYIRKEKNRHVDNNFWQNQQWDGQMNKWTSSPIMWMFLIKNSFCLEKDKKVSPEEHIENNWFKGFFENPEKKQFKSCVLPAQEGRSIVTLPTLSWPANSTENSHWLPSCRGTFLVNPLPLKSSEIEREGGHGIWEHKESLFWTVQRRLEGRKRPGLVRWPALLRLVKKRTTDPT